MIKNQLRLKTLLCAIVLMASVCASAAYRLPRTTPTSAGIEPKQFELLYDSLLSSDITEIHHLMVVVDGKVAGEIHPAPFKASDRHTLYSVSKTFTAVAVGLAVDDGLLSVDDELVKFFPQYAQYIGGIKVKDVLTMRSGFKTNGGMRNSQTDWVDYYLSRPLVATPGTKYSYDSIETYLLSAIVQQVTGKDVLTLLNERVFFPMGIDDVEWERCPKGIVTAGWGIYMTAEAQAMFGQLLLQKGNWKGQQLVSQEWVEEMMTVRVVRKASNDYGYQIWLCEYPGAWRADGAYGQYIIIVPQKNMVVVLNQCSKSKGWPERSNIWHTVVKNAHGCAIEGEPDELENLAKFEANASLPLLKGDATNALAKKYNGKEYKLPKNKLGWKSIKFNFEPNKFTLNVVDAEGKKSAIAMGYNEWLMSDLAGYPHYSISAKGRFTGITGPFTTGACYAWNNDNTLSAKIHYTNWITSLKLDFKFNEKGGLQIEIVENFLKQPFTIEVE
ncbi:MAG: serine hydrolase [Muribaculaceae bacterium]|nr:serine hydrolase [Muribaculaceae bacterium]